MAKEDFVNVRITKFGERFIEQCGGGPLRVHEGGRVGSEFTFTPGETQRVTRAVDWDKVLKNQHVNGQSLFEIVEEDAADPQGAKDNDANENTEVNA
jgi:hypothetical protein